MKSSGKEEDGRKDDGYCERRVVAVVGTVLLRHLEETCG